MIGPAAMEPVTICSSPLIGAGLPTGLRQTCVPFPPGSSACFFTDGLVEAREGDRMIGREELARMVEELNGETAQALLDRLSSRADRTQDDMAACLVTAAEGATDSPGTRVEELEVQAEELSGDVAERFLVACGTPPAQAAEALKAARATAAEFGSAILRVTLHGADGRVSVLPHDPTTPPVAMNGNAIGGVRLPTGSSA